MTVYKNGKKWTCTKWQAIKSEIVKSKKHQLYKYVIDQQNRGNQDKNDFYVSFFVIRGSKLPLDYFYNRYGILGFDATGENYPIEINCYTDYFSIYSPVYCEIDEYGEKLRIWTCKD